MRKKIMIFLAFILMASLSLFTACQTGCQPSGSGEEPDEDETFVYARQEDGTYAISRIKSLEPSEITIPLQFKGKDITFFAENLFAGYENLTDIYFSGEISDWCRIKFGNAEANPMHLRKNLYFNGTIPDGNLNIGNVSRINDYAFVHYDRVANLILEEGITEVGRDAFYDCPNLMTVTLPKSLGRLGFRAFYDLKNLISIHFNGTLSDWMTLEMEEASNPIRASVALYLGDELVEGELIVPEDVKEVGDYVFEFYDKITSVTLSHGVKSIGNSSFYRSSNLETAYLPASVMQIGRYAFGDCEKLKIRCEAAEKPRLWYTADGENWASDTMSVEWGYNNVTYDPCYDYVADGDTAYLTRYKGAEKDVVIPETIDGKSVVSFADIFEENSLIETVAVPDTVTSVWHYAFYSCEKLTEITTGEGVTEIGISAFDACLRLRVIRLGASVERVCENAFGSQYKTNDLQTVSYSGDLEGWCRIDFDNLYARPFRQTWEGQDDHEIDLLIGGSRLEGELVIPDGITEIKDFTFYRCASLTSVSLPSSVTEIGEQAFSSCENLKTLDWKYGIRSIGRRAFFSCYSLESPTFFDSILSIGDGAFTSCESFRTLHLPASLKEIAASAFAGLTLEELVLPDSIQMIDSGAFGSLVVKNLVLPEGLRTVKSHAFRNAEIQMLTLLSNNAEIERYAFLDCTIRAVVAPSELILTPIMFEDATVGAFCCREPEMPDGWFSINGTYDIILNFREFGKTEDYEYTVYNDDTIVLTKYTGQDETVVMPSTINGSKVVDFGTIFSDSENSSRLRSITISDYVTEVSDRSFYNCYELRDLVLGKSVVSVGAEIQHSAWLRRIIIPESVQFISENFLHYYDGIKLFCESKSWKEGWKIQRNIGLHVTVVYNFKALRQNETFEYAILKDDTVTITEICSPAQTIVLPDRIDNLPVRSIAYLTSVNFDIQSVTVPDSVTSIARAAFTGCWELQEVHFEDPDGWQVSETEDFSSPENLMRGNLENPAGAAKFLYERYSLHWWRKVG